MKHAKIDILWIVETKLLRSIQQHNEFDTYIIQMDTIFTNSEDSKNSDHHRLLLNLSHKIILKINILPYWILAFTICGKI